LWPSLVPSASRLLDVLDDRSIRVARACNFTGDLWKA
jgi:hypothetical protein